MPKLACRCGFVHDLSPIPDEGYHTIRERDLDEREGEIRAAFNGDREALGRTLGLWGLLYECPECGRLAWTRDRLEAVRFYLPEPPGEDAPC
jgi:hypothetical protein